MTDVALPVGPARPSWYAEAACRGRAVSLFVPPVGGEVSAGRRS